MDAIQTLLDWPGLLTVPQAAQFLATSPSTLRKWLGAGTFPGFRLNGEWRLNPADVLVYLTNHRNY
jgi:excisionase family DNA binding protein